VLTACRRFLPPKNVANQKDCACLLTINNQKHHPSNRFAKNEAWKGVGCLPESENDAGPSYSKWPGNSATLERCSQWQQGWNIGSVFRRDRS
jgi:hypothetical protein